MRDNRCCVCGKSSIFEGGWARKYCSVECVELGPKVPPTREDADSCAAWPRLPSVIDLEAQRGVRLTFIEHQLINNFRKLGANAKVVARELMHRLAVGTLYGDFDDRRDMVKEAKEEGLDLLIYLARQLQTERSKVRERYAAKLGDVVAFSNPRPPTGFWDRAFADAEALVEKELAQKLTTPDPPYSMVPEVPELDVPIPYKLERKDGRVQDVTVTFTHKRAFTPTFDADCTVVCSVCKERLHSGRMHYCKGNSEPDPT